MKYKISFALLVLAAIFSPLFLLAQELKVDIHFFYSETCAHCADEEKFLEKIEGLYPQVEIHRYLITNEANLKILSKLAKEHDAQRYIGLVPLTFIGDEFFVGFDSEEKMGKEIEGAIKRKIADLPKEDGNKINFPNLGNIDISKYSLPALSAVLGFLDGFNICSLGALVLILGLVLSFRSRTKVLVFGGVFIVTTAVIYGLLIILWHSLFSLLAPYLKAMEMLIAILAIGGGIYFFGQFLKFRKEGPTCLADNKETLASRLSFKMQSLLKNPRNIALVSLSLLLFAAIITIVEFPCSAALPVVYSGLLAQSNVPFLLALSYLAIYIAFYMIDEIIVFLVAFFTMRLWLASPKFITWITFFEAIILFFLGGYYLLHIF